MFQLLPIEPSLLSFLYPHLKFRLSKDL